MTARWDKVCEIFRLALEAEPAARDDVVRGSCGGDALLAAEVEALLSSHDQADGFLETPVFDAAALGRESATLLDRGPLNGRYRVVREIARGGMGAVYLAVDSVFDSEVAIKRSLLAGPAMRVAFEREGRALNRLQHGALPHVTDYFCDDRDAFLVMQYIEGEDLGEALVRRGAGFAFDEVRRWADELLDALEYLHAQRPPVVHRDIKPRNLKRTELGAVRLLDFGLASGLEPGGASVPGYTPDYAPLEQIRGGPTSARSDLYALAATIYHLLVGRKPPGSVERAEAVLAGAPDPLVSDDRLANLAPVSFAAALRAALSLSEAERPASAKELRRTLAASTSQAATPNVAGPAIPVSPSSAAAPFRVPVPLTNLFGREEDVRALAELLVRDGARLVAVTGPAGVGKTRVALELARSLEESFSGGAQFVDLSTVRDPKLVLATLARSLGVKESGSRLLEDAVCERLRERDVLLVLDNFEQVIDGAGAVASLMARAPNAKTLVTSRMRLNVRGEREYRLRALDVPPLTPDPAHESIAHFPSVALFVDRARESRRAFELTPSNARSVAEVCARLDGVPLAIELAAARVDAHTPEAILARLDRQLAVLIDGPRDLPSRQRSMEAAIAWSYELLSPEERAALERFAAFAGGWTTRSGRTALDAGRGATDDSLDLRAAAKAESALAAAAEKGTAELSASLVDKGLASRVATARGDRYRMPEAVREFGSARLGASGDSSAVMRAITEDFLSLAERAEPELVRKDGAVWAERLDDERANFAAAFDWLTANDEEGALRLCGALASYWGTRNLLAEARAAFDRVLGAPGGAPSHARAKALMRAGVIERAQGRYHDAASYLRTGLDVAREIGDDRTASWTCDALAGVEFALGDLAAARASADLAVASAERAGDEMLIAYGRNTLGAVACRVGDWDDARAHCRAALAIAERLGRPYFAAVTRNGLGFALVGGGELDESRACFAESLRYLREIRNVDGLAESVDGLGLVAAARGDLSKALRLAGAASAMRKVVGFEEIEADVRWRESVLGRPYDRASDAWRAGTELSIDETVLLALS